MSSLPLKEVVCALIERNGMVLLAKRGPGRDQAGKWEFPGGKLGPHETPEQALVREIKEELLMDIAIVKPLTVTHYGYADFHIKLIPFLCAIIQGNPVCTEHQAVEWATVDAIMQFDLVAADIPVALEWTLLPK